MSATVTGRDHAVLMDQVYRWQHHIYDATRKYFLFGRDRLISELDCQPGMSVLELGCGTGRNLAAIGRQWPGVRLHGLDISRTMLDHARARLDGSARLALGDATSFDPFPLFETTQFDRVVLSYALSMIPDWRGVLRQALAVVAPTGSLHVVDFGDSNGLPSPMRGALNAWLHRFHVSPRLELGVEARNLAARRGLKCEVSNGPACYYRLVRIGQRKQQGR
jgi:S-adenosylmethionine-diacylgycerolhomoserine-N-methlytransferase